MEQPTVTAQHINLRGIPAFIRHTGATDGPALVLLHGLPTSSFLWRRCLPDLAAALPGWRIIAPDLPGYGRSASRPGAGPRHLGRWLHALLRALNVQHFALAGHDLGGLIALTDAVARTGRLGGTPHPAHSGGPQLDRLILLDTTIYPAPLLVAGLLPAIAPFADLSLAWLGRGGPARDADRRAHYIAGMRPLLAPGTALTDAEWAEYALPYGPIAGWRAATRSLRALAAQAPFVLRCLAHLGDLTLPTRLIWAAHDPFFPLTANRLRRAIPGAEPAIHVIPNSGHFPPEDRPATVTHLLADFLR